MRLLKNFSSISKSDSAIAGGKGASLGEMIRIGIPVPSGFVNLAKAFEKFLEAGAARNLFKHYGKKLTSKRAKMLGFAFYSQGNFLPL